jgi:ABC-type transport system involved in cytochrome c biogenesis permease component
LKLWVVTEASRRFSLDRQSGALELLLSSPITVKQIVRGQVQALEKHFAGPALVVLLADFVFLMADRNTSSWVYFMVATMIVFVADMFTLMWVGMWRGLNSRRPNRAAAAVVARILVLPWVILLMAFILINVFWRHSSGWDEKAFFSLGLAIGIGVDLLFGLPAGRRLLAEFRTVATTRFEKKS